MVIPLCLELSMRPTRLAASLVLALGLASSISLAIAADADGRRRVGRLQPGTRTYLVYMHGAAGSGAKRAMLATSELTRERVDGADAWVIEQHWEDETGIVHTARTVHAASDLATLSQTSGWNRPDRSMTTTVVPAQARGSIEGEVPPEARERMEAGFATMDDGWWINWHSDLAWLPLLPN